MMLFLIYRIRQNQTISHFKAMFYESFVSKKRRILYLSGKISRVERSELISRTVPVGISRFEFNRTHGAVSGGQRLEIYLRPRTRSSKQPGVAEMTTVCAMR